MHTIGSLARALHAALEEARPEECDGGGHVDGARLTVRALVVLAARDVGEGPSAPVRHAASLLTRALRRCRAGRGLGRARRRLQRRRARGAGPGRAGAQHASNSVQHGMRLVLCAP